LGAEALPDVLDRLSEEMEARLLPKTPWTSDKMDQTLYAGMQRAIAPVRFHIETIEGTWKLSQNKSADVRGAAVVGLASSTIGSELEALAALMTDQS
jgi:transcriptional regulator